MTRDTSTVDPSMDAGKWRSVALLAICEVLALALWFSASAVIPAFVAEFQIDDLQASLISSSVAVGFVAGTFTSAALGLADRLDPRRFFMVSALVAALANGAILITPPTSPLLPLYRFVIGACMAGTYPVGMKMVASWARTGGARTSGARKDGVRADMGLLVGILTGALTLGTASPHLIDALGGLDWRFTVAAASILCAGAGLLVNLVRLGPGMARATAFRSRDMFKGLTTPALRLANFGYFGHMWELYAMWAWVGLFLDASFAINPGGSSAGLLAKFATFATIGVGAVGCLLGGVFGDRAGRTTVTMTALAVSGTCCIVVGFLFGADPKWLILVCLIWGVAVVADSAQFSASIMELSEPQFMGTMVTFQTCVGFLLTTVTIHAIPPLVDWVGWERAFAVLAIGPAFGFWAMARLRAHPDAVRIAGGAR